MALLYLELNNVLFHQFEHSYMCFCAGLLEKNQNLSYEKSLSSIVAATNRGEIEASWPDPVLHSNIGLLKWYQCFQRSYRHKISF